MDFSAANFQNSQIPTLFIIIKHIICLITYVMYLFFTSNLFTKSDNALDALALHYQISRHNLYREQNKIESQQHSICVSVSGSHDGHVGRSSTFTYTVRNTFLTGNSLILKEP